MAFPAASNLTANHSHAIASTFYAREALDQLMAKAQFHRFGKMDDIPRANGVTVQWFRDSLPGTNLTATAEGQSGTGLTGSGSTVTATVSQYSDFMTFSDMLVDTALDNRITAQAKNLGYRAAMSVDTIIRNVIDSGALAQTPGASTSLARTDLSQAVHVMQALNIEPLPGGFQVVCSPYVTYDLVNDTTTGSIQDLKKGNGDTSFMNREDRGYVGRYEQYEIWESNNVTVTAGSPDKFRTYVFGKGGYGVIDLAGRGPSKIIDPQNQRFKLKMWKNSGAIGPENPEGKIAGILSYNFVFTAVSLDSTNKRMRKIDTESTIVT